MQQSETHSTGKKWRTVFTKYKAPETKQQSHLGTTSDVTPNNPAPTTNVVTFPGFANLGVKKDQTFTKHSIKTPAQDESPLVPLQVDNEMKKEQEVRAGYLMPDEELLQKWINSS